MAAEQPVELCSGKITGLFTGQRDARKRRRREFANDLIITCGDDSQLFRNPPPHRPCGVKHFTAQWIGRREGGGGLWQIADEIRQVGTL